MHGAAPANARTFQQEAEAALASNDNSVERALGELYSQNRLKQA